MRGAPRLLRFAKAVTIICAGFFWMTGMECRPGCGACCIAPSISSAIPGMPNGKPAGVRCLHLTDANYCGLFRSEEHTSELQSRENIVCRLLLDHKNS